MAGGRFAHLADAGQRLGARLEAEGIEPGALVLAVVPNGVPVARQAARVAGLELGALRVRRGETAVEVAGMPAVAGRTVLVVDDGVETGTVARAVVAPLREAGAASVVLAVPVCPAGALADLSARYDRVIAVEVPTDGRPLAAHFAAFDTLDEGAAEALLGAPLDP